MGKLHHNFRTKVLPKQTITEECEIAFGNTEMKLSILLTNALSFPRTNKITRFCFSVLQCNTKLKCMQTTKMLVYVLN